MATACGQIFIVMPHSRRAFVDRLDFLTSLGHGEGGDDRARRGIRSSGPTRVITDLCVMEPDAQTRELTVTALHPGVTADKVRTSTGWNVRVAPQPALTAEPTSHELETLRTLRARTSEAHGAD
jgi:glutaconate CoA-transferase subunit B